MKLDDNKIKTPNQMFEISEDNVANKVQSLSEIENEIIRTISKQTKDVIDDELGNVSKPHEHVKIWIFAGPREHGAIAMMAARLLIRKGYRAKCFLINIYDNLSKWCKIEKNKFFEEAAKDIEEITKKLTMPSIQNTDIIIDGLFGDVVDPPKGGFRILSEEIRDTCAKVISIDYDIIISLKIKALNL